MIEIKKQIRGFLREFTPGPLSWQIPVYMQEYPNEYRGVGVNPYVFLLEDEIDIAGLTTHEEKALVISHVETQQSPVYYAGAGLAVAAPYSPLTRNGMMAPEMLTGCRNVRLPTKPYGFNVLFSERNKTAGLPIPPEANT